MFQSVSAIGGQAGGRRPAGSRESAARRGITRYHDRHHDRHRGAMRRKKRREESPRRERACGARKARLRKLPCTRESARLHVAACAHVVENIYVLGRETVRRPSRRCGWTRCRATIYRFRDKSTCEIARINMRASARPDDDDDDVADLRRLHAHDRKIFLRL